MKLRIFIDLDYDGSVSPLAEAKIRDRIATAIHDMAREHAFNGGGHMVNTMACAVARIEPGEETPDEPEETC